MNNDLKIAQAAKLDGIYTIAEKAGIRREYVEPYGNDKAKILPAIHSEIDTHPNGRLILVTAINPTPAGEGKSTTTIGLADGLQQIGKKAMACLREPSLGPVFGLKGGAAGGGYAQVVPMESINLHFTGDMHAITTANNLIAAVLDNSIYQGNPLNIDPARVVWPRCMDMNDRTLRSITIAQDKKTNGIERKDHFVITVATEVMAILCLSRDLHDFQERIGRCIVAYTYDGKPVTVRDLKVDGAAAVVMKDALKPNLVQTLEHTPVFVHGGPFANIAHGCNSIIATTMALKLADYVVTEAGFGADLGAEKFMDIKCRTAGIHPDAVVIVATVRALKLHGGVELDHLDEENVEAMLKGTANLAKHMESIKSCGVPFTICINRFSSDTEAELNALKKWCEDQGCSAEISEGWAKGGKGTIDLARKVVELCDEPNDFHCLYPLEATLKEKIEAIAKTIYGAEAVEYAPEAEKQLKQFADMGYDSLPVCMAKTPLSLSDDPKLKGRPQHVTIHVRSLSVSAGAGFVVVYTGSVLTMPGLPKDPAAVHMGINPDGTSYGIF